MFGEINVYEVPLIVHKCAANGINGVRLEPPLQGFDCSLPAASPTMAGNRHIREDRNSSLCITPGQKFRAGVKDFLLLRKVWNHHHTQGIKVLLNFIQQKGERKWGKKDFSKIK